MLGEEQHGILHTAPSIPRHIPAGDQQLFPLADTLLSITVLRQAHFFFFVGL
jgi:hypothetical protein